MIGLNNNIHYNMKLLKDLVTYLILAEVLVLYGSTGFAVLLNQ